MFEEGGRGGSTYEDGDVEYPSPALLLGDETSPNITHLGRVDGGTKGGPQHQFTSQTKTRIQPKPRISTHRRTNSRRQTVNAHRRSTDVPGPQVRNHTSGIRERRARGQTDEESADEHGFDVGREGDAEIEKDEKEPADYVDWFTAKD